jgi:hypothetical protein
MQRLLLLTLIIAVICVPVFAARERTAFGSLKKTLFMFAAFDLFFMLAMMFLYGFLQ